MSEWTGKTLGKVRIERLLGRGGMAEVYLGTHTLLIRPVAVKVIHGFLDDNSDLRDRFLQEARVVAGLRHPNIVQVFDYDVFEERPYYVMEYIDGPSLGTYLRSLHERQARMPLGMIRRILPMLASALDSAHRQGVIHRDIKPGNVLLRSVSDSIMLGEALPSDVEPLLADFGLVRLMDSSFETKSGTITGTPAYMSPEQAGGGKVDHRSDVYSLGIVLYEMLSGHVPFDGDTPMQVMSRVLQDAPLPIPNLSVPLQDVLNRALEKDPQARFQSAGELSNAFLSALGLLTESDTLPPLQLPASKIKDPEPRTTLILNRVWGSSGGIFAMLALGLIIFAALLSRLPKFSTSVSATSTTAPAATPSVMDMSAVPLPGFDSFGALRFQDVSAILDGVSVGVSGLPLPAAGTQYEVWLVGSGGETRRSLGVLALDVSGSGAITFVDGQSRNLLASYDHMEITLEPSPDSSPNPSDIVVYSSSMVPESLMHVRHVLVSISNTPNQIGLIHGLLNNGTLVEQAAHEMLSAYDAGDEKTMRLKAETVLNIIVGSQSKQYGDADGDGVVTDPSDGYGLLLNGESPGYIEGVISHTQYAMAAIGAPDDVLLHGGHVIISAQNVEGWVVQLRDLAVSILNKPFNASLRQSVAEAVALADQCINGIDLDGNERVDPLPGEGGILTAYQHAYYMADLTILSGADQVMPAGVTP